MIEETATVMRADEQYAWVSAQRQSACGQCSAQKGCGTGTLASVFGKKMNYIRAINAANAQEGDVVVIGLNEGILLKSAFITYLVPIVFMLAGAIIFSNILSLNNELHTIIGAVVGFLIALWFIRIYATRTANNKSIQPVVLRKIVNKTDCVPG